ncbi:hypothetical protein K431DRAFT_63032 [Polychaeton citri CBS 116435]|uniref:Uncharacterized protein n=1 Tax=Polychaeton citri CBS 116435 TaxID=1314669 RepID=A0A9P4Q9N0_9PEZI|nr:hypothetical protein K431DRAFT_63032 [Polychaeton citri CBS 116435]
MSRCVSLSPAFSVCHTCPKSAAFIDDAYLAGEWWCLSGVAALMMHWFIPTASSLPTGGMLCRVFAGESMSLSPRLSRRSWSLVLYRQPQEIMLVLHPAPRVLLSSSPTCPRLSPPYASIEVKVMQLVSISSSSESLRSQQSHRRGAIVVVFCSR